MAKQNFLNATGSADVMTSMFLLAGNAMSRLNRVNNTYYPGILVKDTGYQRVGDVFESKAITGLHNFRQTASVQKMLATMNDSTDDDTQLAYNNAGTWTEIGAAETAWANKANINVEMEDFIGYCFMVGHGSTDGFLPPGSLTGTTFSTSTNVTSMPNAKYIKRYRDKLYLGNCDISGTAWPFRIYFSSVPSGSPLTITWTSTDFLTVDFSEEITGLGQNWDRLIAFTEFSAYMYDGISFKKVWDVGCSNHRTIRTIGQYMIWANRDGVWISTGGYPQNISRKVQDFIKNGSPKNFFGELVDEEHSLYVGNVTVKGISYTNCELIYNIPLNAWRWGELAHNIKIYAEYNDSGTLRKYMGDESGNIWNKSKYTDTTVIHSDGDVAGTAGSAIHGIFEYPPIHLGDPSILKKISEFIAYSQRAQGLQMSYRIIDKNTRALTPYKPITQLDKFISTVDVFSDEGNLLQIQGTESSTNPYFEFFGFTLDIKPSGKTLK